MINDQNEAKKNPSPAGTASEPPWIATPKNSGKTKKLKWNNQKYQ